MSDEERHTVVVATVVLMLASFVRLAWEARPVPPILPPAPVPEELLEETRLAVEREDRMSTPLAPDERIDPNEAPDVELARLPGIGPGLAARIVASREQEGDFDRASDLLRVSGIGPATLERIRPYVDLPDRRPEARAGARQTGRLASRESQPLDLNSASANELEALPGLGPTLSRRIVDHRQGSGPFEAIDDLVEVSGIGQATIERLRPLVRIGP